VPPRYAYWTILIDQQATAFRAREQEELLPTLAQLRRTSTDVVVKWFAHGRLWDSPDQERLARGERRAPAFDRRAAAPAAEKRGREWRPGGQHRDPRARFKKHGPSKSHGPKRRR